MRNLYINKWVGILVCTLLFITGCSYNNVEEETNSIKEKKQEFVKQEAVFSIDKNKLFSEIETIVVSDDLDLIHTIWNDVESEVGPAIELNEIKRLEPIMDILATYPLNVFEDHYIVSDYEIGWAESILSESDYVQLEELVDQLAELELDSYFDDADEVWMDIEILLTPYQSDIDLEYSEGSIPLERSDFYETYADYYVEYDKFEFSENPDMYVRGINNPRSEIDHFVFMYWWDHIKQLFPQEYMKFIVGYDLTSDGWGGNYAMVWQDSEDYNKWHLTVDPADAVEEDGTYNLFMMDETLVHEFAHILTLNHEQMKRRMSEKSDTYTTDEGTLKEDAYLNHFYQTFWAGFGEKYRVESDFIDAYDDILLYEDFPESFVTEYAATHPAEDIAESFIYFVTLDKPEGNLIKDKKIRFFYAYPELVEMRDRMRKHIDWQE